MILNIYTTYYFLTCIKFLLRMLVLERFIVQMQVDLDCATGRLEIEGVPSEDVLQPQETHVRTQRHLSHAIRVEIELIFYYF